MDNHLNLRATVTRSIDPAKLEKALHAFVGTRNTAEAREKITEAVRQCISTDINIQPGEQHEP